MEGILGQKLREYKRKFYLNRLIRNSIIGLIMLLGVWLSLAVFEYTFDFDTYSRLVLFVVLCASIFSFFVIGILWPLIHVAGFRRQISDEEAATEVGQFFPEIKDKLLNTIQLRNENETSLVIASINRRIEELTPFQFSKAIDLRLNWKYGRVLVGIIALIILSSVSFPTVFLSSSERILKYDEEFTPTAPFQFVINNDLLQTFRNEDFSLNVSLVGEAVPEDAYIIVNGRRAKLARLEKGHFGFTFSKPYQDIQFNLEAAGFLSTRQHLEVVNRPDIKSFEIKIDYPAHTGRQDELIENTGNIQIPEGSDIQWLLNTEYSENSRIVFAPVADTLYLQKEEDLFTGKKRILEDTRYRLEANNEFGANGSILEYEIAVKKDLFPTVEVEFFMDTVLFEYVIAAGRVADDYGLRHLEINSIQENTKESFPIGIQSNNKSQSFYYQLNLDSLGTEAGDRLEIFLQVTDNDAINRFKTTKSRSFILELPSEKDIRESIDEKRAENEKELSENIESAESINEKIKEVQNRLRSKKEIGWQEERLLEEIMKQREKLENNLEELKEQFRQLNESQDKFSDRSDEIKKKADQIQQLMEEILDEETKKLYEELQELLKEKAQSEDIQNLLEEMAPNELNLEEELERTLELFKRLQMESKLDEATNDLQELAEQQEELAQQTMDEANDLDSLAGEQKNIQEKFEDIQEQLEEVEELNEDLKNPEPLQDFSQEENEINDLLQESQEQMQEQNRKGSQQKQQQTGQKMKELGEKMAQMQAGMQMEMMQEDLDNLRDIVDNLVKLSFQEESLIKDFRSVRQVDPRFVDLSQQQLKLKEDAKVIQDSLMSLASRVPQISNFVTREVTDMNRNIDDALGQLRERNRSKALSSQQFAMASINNLSLLLSDVLQQMQQAMASQSGKGQGQKKKGNSISELKQLQQQLSEQIKQLQDSGMKGRKLSEQLAKMAAQQEMIRNQIREFQEQLKGQPGNKEAGDNLGKILEEMEKNEVDLVNKRLTQELINRQKEIETRMLDAEESLKDQGFDNKREGESAKDYDRRRPEAFEEYLQEKQRELELLKSVPLELSPFYKKELNDYFRRISSDY